MAKRRLPRWLADASSEIVAGAGIAAVWSILLCVVPSDTRLFAYLLFGSGCVTAIYGGTLLRGRAGTPPWVMVAFIAISIPHPVWAYGTLVVMGRAIELTTLSTALLPHWSLEAWLIIVTGAVYLAIILIVCKRLLIAIPHVACVAAGASIAPSVATTGNDMRQFGFAVALVHLGVAVSMVWAALESNHRSFLIASGHCPSCGYDTSTTYAACPECGKHRDEARDDFL